jgi:hypothetical protein
MATTTITIAVPGWVVAQFQETGLAPLAWSQQAVSEAVRSAVKDQAAQVNLVARMNADRDDRLAQAKARLSEARVHAIVMAAHGRRFNSCNLTQLSNITGLGGAVVKSVLESLKAEGLVDDIGRGSAWRVRLAPEMTTAMREAGLI